MDTQRRETSAPELDVTRSPSKGRRIAFRVLAVITGLWFLAYYLFGLTEVVLMWLPMDTLRSIIPPDDQTIPDLAIHRAHFMSVGIMSWTVLLAVFSQWRKPQRRVAQMLQLVGIALGAALMYGLSGTLVESLIEEGTVVVPVLALAALHPRFRDFFRVPTFDRPMLGMAAGAAVPWLVFAIDNAWLQLTNAAGDPHAEFEHWAVAALMAVTIVLCTLLGSSDHDGWRMPAWVAAGASLVYGVHSLVFPGLPSALPGFWAATAIVWALGFGALIVRRSRRGSAVAGR